MVSILVLIYFGKPLLRHAIKTNCITFQTVDPNIYSIFDFIEKGLSISLLGWFSS